MECYGIFGIVLWEKYMTTLFDFNQELDTLLIGFYGTGAIKINTEPGEGWKLAQHRKNATLPLSPSYFNLRTLNHPTKPGPLTKSEVRALARLMYERLKQKKIEFDGLCGVPDAGAPLALALQEHYYNLDRRYVPLLTLLKGMPVHDALKNAQGLPRGSTVLLIDDVITDAGSKVREGIEPLRWNGYVVKDCIVGIDREQGGGAQLGRPAVQVRLISIATASQVFDRFLRARIITPDVHAKLQEYHTACAA